VIATVSAERVLHDSPERIYAFLAELENHRRLSDRYFRVESLRPDRGGGRISIRAPGGLPRTARTDVTTAVAPRRFGGTASAGRRTQARVLWKIEPDEQGSLVALEATVVVLGVTDRVLLGLGGRRWLRRRFDRVVARLGVEVEGFRGIPDASTAASGGRFVT
jgi:hypothetical protein